MVIEMQKRWWSIGLLGILIFMMALPALAVPWKVNHGNTFIRKGEVVRGDLYFAGESLEIEGEVQGDVLVIAEEVKVTGKIDGSLFGLVYGKLTVDGSIGEDLRVVASQAVIGGTVGETVSSAAMMATFTPKSVVNKGIIGLYHQAKLSGRVDGGARITSYGAMALGGKINGDVQLRGVPVTWAKGATVHGNVDDYSGTANTAAATRANISGDYRMHQDNEFIFKVMKNLLIFSLMWFLGSVLTALVFYKLFPRTSWRISDPSAVYFRKNLWTGFLGALGIPVIIFVLFITRVGIPLAILLILGYITLLLFSNVLLYLWMGRLIFSRSRLDLRRHPVLLIITGGIALAVVGLIPLAGYFLQVIGFGMVLSQIRPELNENQHDDILA